MRDRHSTLGLAERGHEVTASDISPAAIARARSEAERRGLSISFSVADMRSCDSHYSRVFDAVLNADDSVPHLLSDAGILKALRAFYSCTRPGGAVLITVRDYAREDRSSPQLRPYGVHRTAEGRWIVFQVWEFDGDHYDMAMYFVLEPDNGAPQVIVSRALLRRPHRQANRAFRLRPASTKSSGSTIDSFSRSYSPAEL